LVLSLVAWDVFDAVLAPRDVILLMSWSDHDAVEAFEVKTPLRGCAACVWCGTMAIRPARSAAVLF
jgi:hypothetical protein